MTSVANLVQLLKTGVISKETFMEKMSCSSVVLSDFHRGTTDSLKLDLSAIKNDLPSESFNTHKNAANSSRPSSSFSIRQEQWLSRRSMSHAKLKEAKVDAESQECTFQPKITTGSNKSQCESAFARLSRTRTDMERLREDYKQKESFDQLKDCTFHPTINPKSRNLSARPSSMTSPRHNPDVEHCTFTPVILGVKKSMSKASQYVQNSAFKRLTEPKEDECLAPQAESHVPKPIPYESEFVNKPFYERQASYEVMKLERQAKRLKKEPSKPAINEISRRLVTSDFETRNRESIEKKKKPAPSQEPEYPFHPNITRLAHEIRNTQLHKQTPRPVPKAESPPKPLSKSSTYSHVKSRLRINDEAESYISRVTRQQRERENYALYVKAVRDEQELQECTHVPKTTDAPKYIHQIASSYAELKCLKNTCD
jgi:hypothetical protein